MGMTKICKNCACYEVCFMANPCRTEDCNINWQPIVVRCKDCKHWQESVDGITKWCPLLMDKETKADDFCFYGERKDNER